MQFELNEEQHLLQAMVREFAAREVAPFDATMDREDHINMSILQKMKEVGLWGIVGDEQYGGAGAGTLGGAVVMEELARGSGSIALTLDAHWLCLEGIQIFGSAEQKQKYLPEFVSGDTIGAFSWTEPAAGSDAAGIQAFARKINGGYTLSGTKCFVTNGGLAGIYLVGARTSEEEGAKSFSVFILEEGAAGLKVGAREDKMGMRGSHTTEIILENVQAKESQLLGAEGDGFKIAMEILNGGRISIGAISVGTAAAAMTEAVGYVKSRKAFGKALADQQAVQFKLADMDTSIQAARLLVYKAAQHKDDHKPYHKEAAQAKVFASEMATRVCLDAIQLQGGYGYTRDASSERYLRNAKLAEIGEGASEVLRMLIGRAIVK
ncbi:hypothetical protein AUK40_03130 [Candidatus Wirthbacteria bacterium CG2_30_54_11]|uniref:Acyl-CoA dehydrogenase n=1 Tax=Candidatus Wirthbacteria bacterium CG2_30_54_11 TaxID=1817892 RepID=A0A1J5IYX1_9BACT|nr:MAG: hypothetical protein AUK40_03130 [Candidatus Wirthbacteria bacterium CG2_30_54_11]